MVMKAVRLFWLPLILSTTVLAQQTPVAIRGGTILTGTGEVVEGGTIVYQGGRIVSVGVGVSDGSDTPADATVVDASGLFVTPGFIDAYSHYGLQGSTWERDALEAPGKDFVDRFSPDSEPSEWLRSGVTTTYLGPSGENLLGGVGVVVKLAGASRNQTVVRTEAAMSASFGEAALDAFDAPTTRQGMIATLRQTFISVEEDSYVGPGGAALVEVLDGNMPLHAFSNTPDDILTALRLANEFDLALVLTSAIGGHEVAEAIARANVPVIVGPSIIGIGGGGPYEGFAHTPSNAARLHAAGVRIALGTFSRQGRSVVMEAALAKSHGLSEDAALRAVTSDAAAILGVEGRVGSLEAGKDADIVVWKNHPLGTWGEPTIVIVDGQTVFER
jgi:imidazolonepropionase-like amidohydrolase